MSQTDLHYTGQVTSKSWVTYSSHQHSRTDIFICSLYRYPYSCHLNLANVITPHLWHIKIWKDAVNSLWTCFVSYCTTLPLTHVTDEPTDPECSEKQSFVCLISSVFAMCVNVKFLTVSHVDRDPVLQWSHRLKAICFMLLIVPGTR